MGRAGLQGLQVAFTVDELLVWDGAPIPDGYSRAGIVDAMIKTFAEHEVNGIYGFAHTSPLDSDAQLRAPLERWVAAGHHLGNHTHAHASLNWVDADAYCRDIDRADAAIGDLIGSAPERYFRYAMDMTGPSEARRGAVEDHLKITGYTNAPITSWFGDFAWIAPYYRALTTRDDDAANALRASFVGAALFELQAHADAALTLFGHDVPLIQLIHGTPIAQDCLGPLLHALADAGVELVPLPVAMSDISNRVASPVDARFRNHLQRLATARGLAMTQIPSEQVAAVLDAAPLAGFESIPVYEEMLRRMCTTAGGTYNWDWS